jgi:1-deoxy-D-xylulose-5-phosphate synthase
MPIGTGLDTFACKYPDRFFDAGIAEQHAVTFSAGLAKGGFVPVVAVYSSFLQRAYDQILHDVCLQNLHIVFCVDRAGIVGEDGETHQGVYDISFLSAMPNMTILAPANFTELEEMLSYAVKEHNGPVAIRYPRGSSQCIYENAKPFKLYEPDEVTNGDDVCILCAGTMLDKAIAASEILAENNISATVVNIRTLFPLNKDYIKELSLKYSLIVTVEDGVRRGGFGEAVSSCLSDISAKSAVIIKAHENPVVPHGAPEILYKNCGLDSESIAHDILNKLKGSL